jgi:hypothetical protein
VQGRSISWTFLALAAAAGLYGAVLAPVSRAQEAVPSVESAGPAPPPASAAQWREAPDYLALFVPRIDRRSYRAFVSPLPLDAVLHGLAPDDDRLHPPGAWTARPENPLDAFGNGGTYDRFAVARLFGSHRPQVARGPRGRQGRVEESWTLVSPYPAADLSHLEPGTLLIALRVP